MKLRAIGLLGIALSGCSASSSATQSPSPVVVATPTPAATATAAPPSPTDTPPPTPSPILTDTLMPSRSPQPSLTPGPDGWIGPMVIETADWQDLSMALDSDGFVHATFVRNGRIQYLTNRSGSWVRQRVSLPDGEDNEPSIAVDTDGTVGIAFTRFAAEDPAPCRDYESHCPPQPEGVFYVTDESGDWSTAEPFGPPVSNSPKLALREGQIHLAYADSVLCGEICGPAGVHYRTNAGGAWTDIEVGETFGSSDFALGPDGDAYALFSNLVRDNDTPASRFQVSLARVATGSQTVQLETVWEHDAELWVDATMLALDASGNPHVIIQMTIWDEGNAPVYLTREAGDWIEQPAPPTGQVSAPAVDRNGSLHFLTCCDSYLTNRSGEYATHELAESDLVTCCAHGDIAIDAQGRPHVLFARYTGEGAELWYAIGPGY